MKQIKIKKKRLLASAALKLHPHPHAQKKCMLEGMALKAKLHLHSILKMILGIWLERKRCLKEKKWKRKILYKFHDEKKFIYALSQVIMNQ